MYVLKRPGVDLFLKKLSEIYELVIYTASLSKYANPLLDWLDPEGLCSYRLFREHCTFRSGVFVKDLSRIDRDLKDTIIIDNSPTAYMMHPQCALPITSWYDDMEDTELHLLLPILEGLQKVNDVRTIIKPIVFEDKVLFNKALQILQGGRVGERSHSQQPKLRSIQENSDEFYSGENLNSQSGDLSQEPNNESQKNSKDESSNDPAISYFKSFKKTDSLKNRKQDNKPRSGSQRRSQYNDPNKIHFMPRINKSKNQPSDTMRNGWVTKLDQDPSQSPMNCRTNYMEKEPNESSQLNRGSLKMRPNHIIFSKNQSKGSSVPRNYRRKYKPESSSQNRLGKFSARNTGEYRMMKSKRELTLYGTNKVGQSTTRLDNRPNYYNMTPSRNKVMSSTNTSPVYNFMKKPNSDVKLSPKHIKKQNQKLSKILKEMSAGKPSISKGQRNYISKIMNNMNLAGNSATVQGRLGQSKSSLKLAEMSTNNNHRHAKIPRFTSSKNLPLFTELNPQSIAQPPESGLFIMSQKD